MKLGAVVLIALASVAHAAPIVALAPAPDARDSIALGPHGEAYEGDGKGAWVRRHAGGLADDVVRATRAGDRTIVQVDGGPPYAFHAGVWNMVVLGLHAKAVVGRGSRATAAFGRQVFGLDTGKPVKVADAPGVVQLLGSSGKAIVVQTDKGLARLDGATWKPIANAPKQVIALLDDRWALVDRGVMDLKSQKLTAWPTGFRVASVVSVDGDVVAVGGNELVTIRGKLAREKITVTLASIVSVVADKSGRVVVAAKDGQLAVRDKAGAWTKATVRDDLPADKPGSPPAESR